MDPRGDLWRLEVSGRFLAAAGVVYPGGVPFPEDLHNEMPVVANEVWLYADEDGMVVGTYWWPDAVRKPIASVPREEYAEDAIAHPDDATTRVDVRVPIPTRAPWHADVAVCLSPREVIVFCVTDSAPDPLNEMLVYEHGGVSVRARSEAERPDLQRFLSTHQPPYRRLEVRGTTGVGRDPGRSLGPQTWPWPGQLRWWEPPRGGAEGERGVDYEAKGFVRLATLVEIAESMEP